MAGQEFLESDIIFSDATHDNNNEATVQDNGIFINRRSGLLSNNNRSVPVNIPVNFVYNCSDEENGDFDDDDERRGGGGGGGIVPPHVIMGRRLAAKITFSVCIGNGRTLKGRDLNTVRNSILRSTGFLES